MIIAKAPTAQAVDMRNGPDTFTVYGAEFNHGNRPA